VCARVHVCTHSLLYCVFSETNKRVCTYVTHVSHMYHTCITHVSHMCHTCITHVSHTCRTLAYICSNTKTLEKRVCAHVLVGEYAGVRMQPSRVCTCVTQMSHIYHTHVSTRRRSRAKSGCTCICVCLWVNMRVQVYNPPLLCCTVVCVSKGRVDVCQEYVGRVYVCTWKGDVST